METPVTEILRLPTVESKPRPREMLGQFLTSFSGNCGAKFWKNFLPGWRLRSTKPPKFSILPYFLYCRAIELGLKAIHLETDKQQDVKDEYGHNLVKSYEALPPERRTLSPTDTDLLAQINKLYVCKAFEYVQPGDAANAFSSFPDLEQLARLATNFASE
jgi:hypothetical protein